MVTERIPIEASLALISAHFGIDFLKYDIDAPIDTLEAPNIAGIIGAFRAVPGQKFTLREAAIRHGTGMSMPHITGTPSRVADQMVAFIEEGASTVFSCAPRITRRNISTTSSSC